jgi:hypothetical protein
VSEATAKLIGTLIGQAIGLLVLSFICAWVLSWRATALRSWRIPYRSAYFVSVKAVFISFILGVLATRGGDYLGGANHGFALPVGVVLGIASWWFAHRSALLKLEIPRIVVWPKDARAISVSVFGFVMVILMASSGAILATIFVISLFIRSTVS